MNNDFSATLYDLRWDGLATPVAGFHWNRDEVVKSGAPNLLLANLPDDVYGHNPDRWSGALPYSCAISLYPWLTVQVGNLVKIEEAKGKVVEWDLRGGAFLGDNTLVTHQARFYSDGTFVVCSNQGLYLRYWDFKTNQQTWAHDSHLESVMVQRVPLHNGALYRVLNDDLGLLMKERSSSLSAAS